MRRSRPVAGGARHPAPGDAAGAGGDLLEGRALVEEGWMGGGGGDYQDYRNHKSDNQEKRHQSKNWCLGQTFTCDEKQRPGALASSPKSSSEWPERSKKDAKLK